MAKIKIQNTPTATLLKRRNILLAIIITMIVILIIYVGYFAYRQLYLELEMESSLIVGMLVILTGMLPAFVLFNFLTEELKRRDTYR